MSETKVYFADVTVLEDGDLFEKYYSTLPAYRRAKIDLLKRRDDKTRSLGAVILLSRALKSVGVDENAEISVGKNGKPFLKNAQNFNFNLSHSGKLVMCAVSDREIGCDVETVRDGRLGVAERFFTATEREFIDFGDNEKEKNERFFRLWTLKEGFIKANGAGLSVPLNTFSLVRDGKILYSLYFDGKNYVFYEVDTGRKDYKAAVCIADGTEEDKPGMVFEIF